MGRILAQVTLETPWPVTVGVLWQSSVLRLCQFPNESDGPEMRFVEVMSKVVSLTEISFCPIFILLFGVAQSYRSVK